MTKEGLARRIAKLLSITGYAISWKDKSIQFAKNHSEINLVYYLIITYTVQELIDLWDHLLSLLDNEEIAKTMEVAV